MDIQVLASGSKGNCYRVRTDGVSSLLLDCGIPAKRLRESLGFGLSQLAGCLCTHEHGDHARAVPDLLKASVDVYASRGTIDALGLQSHRLHAIEPSQWFAVGEWEAYAFPIIHDAREPVGFLCRHRDERLLYMTDTAYSPYRFTGLTCIMIEANYDREILRRNVESGAVSKEVERRVLRSHMSIERTKDFLRACDLSQVTQIWLLHLSDGNSDAARFKIEIQQLTGKVVRVA